jgi:hypothetical protein
MKAFRETLTRLATLEQMDKTYFSYEKMIGFGQGNPARQKKTQPAYTRKMTVVWVPFDYKFAKRYLVDQQ